MQFGHRFAAIGMAVVHCGHNLVSGADGATASLRLSALIARTRRKTAKVTMRKVTTLLRNAPYLHRDRPRRLGGLERRVGAGGGPLAQGQEQVGEVDATESKTDRRHDDVVDQALDDGAESAADDDADGQIDHVAL